LCHKLCGRQVAEARAKLSSVNEPVSKRENFNRDTFLPLLPERARVLSIISDNDELFRGVDDDLLLKKTSAAALDQRQLLVDLVRSVDRQIEFWSSLEIGKQKTMFDDELKIFMKFENSSMISIPAQI
jgi:hypothetical protein